MKKMLIIIYTCLCIPMFGCAKHSGSDYAAYYPECRQPILQMQGQHSAGANAAKGAVGGALIGGATGFFVGLLLHGGNAANAGLSAAAGAAAGGLSGGISGAVNSTPNTAEENKLLAEYYEKIEGDVSGLSLRQAAGTYALQCYRKKLAQVDELENAEKMTFADAEKRRREIEEGMASARELIGERPAAMP